MPSSRISLVDEKENSQMEQIQKHIRNVSNKILYLPSWISWEMDASRKSQNDMGSMSVHVMYLIIN